MKTLPAETFEATVIAAARAMFVVDGRIDDTASARWDSRSERVYATRALRAQMRRELHALGVRVTPRPRTAR